MSSRHDFDFLFGHEWRVENRVLRERLAGCTEWDEFSARLSDVRPLLGGLANCDRFSGVRDGKPFEASSLRVFDPTEETWHIYWLDTLRYRIEPQVSGRFVDGVGELYGQDRFEGRTVDLRFLWTDVDGPTPRWEQAYRDPSTGEWETNWVMEFHRAR